jgi:outer membrane protein
MGNVGTALELGAFVSYTFPGGSRVRLRARHDVISGHGGAIATADYLVPLLRTNRVTLGAIVAGTWASGAYMRSYFGVNAAQSAASGYPIFNATSGFKDVNTGLNAIYMIAQQWSVVGNVSYKRLIGQAADSPIVRIAGSPNQMNYAAYLVYSF